MRTQKVLIPFLLLSFILIGCNDTKDTAVRAIDAQGEELGADSVGDLPGGDLNGSGDGSDGGDNGGGSGQYELSDYIENFNQKTLNQTSTKFVFVIDNSDSMSDEQTNLEASLNGFVQNLISSNNDFHMLVTTTSLAYKGQLTHGMNELTRASYNSNPSAFMNDFGDAVNIGICGDANHAFKNNGTYNGNSVNCGDEAPLIMGKAILEKYTQAPNLVIGNDDNVVMLFVSDETAYQFGDSGTIRVSATNNMTTMINSFYSFITPSKIEFFTVYLPLCYIDNNGNSTSGYRNDSLEQCNQNGILANMANGTGFDIRNNFSDLLNDVANTATSLQSTFVLTSVPSQYSSLEVRVNGVKLTQNQFTFNANNSSITITDPNMLIDGSTIQANFIDGIQTEVQVQAD
ncbi:hypothetical protein N9N67_07300 [Bacteriovoracaceae bacterium]|nr:hypothetical protein [Bacteriovoracaceae bacterium]